MARFAILAAALLAGTAAPASAELIVGLTTGNGLVLFDSTDPSDIINNYGVIGGLAEDLVGIDRRPATDTLYGLGSAGGIYTIALAGTANATLVATLSVVLNGTSFGIDFNPVVDRLRIVSNADQNLRADVMTGVAIVDAPLSYDPGDPNAGANPNIVAAAYTNSFAPSPRTPPPGTQLYYLDSNLNILVETVAPNAGSLLTAGAAGNPNDLTGFDISGASGDAFASWAGSLGTDLLFLVNLDMGGVSLLGMIGSGLLGIEDIAVAPSQPLQVPAPAGLALFGLGIAALGFARRK